MPLTLKRQNPTYMPHITVPTAQNFISDKPTVGKIIFPQQTSFNLTNHFLSCYILGLVEALLREGLQGVYNLILVEGKQYTNGNHKKQDKRFERTYYRKEQRASKKSCGYSPACLVSMLEFS